MGELFTLDDDIKALVQLAFDDVITEFGKDCLLVYPPRWKPCVNCVLDPIGHKSSNKWKNGGPLPFPNGNLCPMCNGDGRRAEEQTEVVKLLCAWEPKSFFYPMPGLDIRVPYSILQTKCLISEVPKLLRADHVIFEIPSEAVVRKRFKLLGAPGDSSNIIQNRYYVAVWEQIT